MASLRRKPNSKYWVACFNLSDGLRVQRSTKTTDRRLAQRLADQYEEAGKAQIIESQARRIIADIHKRLTGRPLQSITIRTYLNQWLGGRTGTVAPATHSAYQSTIEEFLGGIGPKAEMDLPLLVSGDFAAFRDRIGSLLSASTANKKLKIMKVAMQQAWRDGLVESNPAARVQTLKASTEASARRPFTLDELRQLLTAASGEWLGLILFGLYTGQRLGDLVRLRWSAIDLNTATLALTTQKTSRRQILPLARPLLRWLTTRQRGKGTEPLFQEACDTVEATGRVGTLSNRFQRILTTAGLARTKAHSKRADGAGRDARRATSELSFHSLRHTATSMMKNAGISPAIVQEFVGHDSKVISENYTHIETEVLRKAAESLPDLLESPKA